jgi:hypothetical protein
MKKTGKTPKANRALKRRKVTRAAAKTPRLIIGLAAFEKVSAIEGLHLTRDMKNTFAELKRRGASAAQRRAAIIKRYG